MTARSLLLVLTGAATMLVGPHDPAHISVPAGGAAYGPIAAAAAGPTNLAAALAAQDFPYYTYNGQWTFVRIRTNGGRRGFRRGWGAIGSSGGPGWSHDYPDAERNFSKILRELTFIDALVEDYGGNILTFDDPRLTQFPLAYISEPGEWDVSEDEIEGLRNYILKGGFLIFDDFQGRDMFTLAEQMKYVLPELDWLPLDGSEPIFDSFFKIEPATLQFSVYGMQPDWYGMFLENDKSKRMIAVAANNGDFGEQWEYSDRGFYPIDISNEAYKVGINYVVYAMTH
jgi:hypothetical protein